jgi:RimJ/RimL family protein N-acetyltransferase
VRGRGIVTEALNLAVEWAFRDHEVVRIQLVIWSRLITDPSP